MALPKLGSVESEVLLLSFFSPEELEEGLLLAFSLDLSLLCPEEVKIGLLLFFSLLGADLLLSLLCPEAALPLPLALSLPWPEVELGLALPFSLLCPIGPDSLGFSLLFSEDKLASVTDCDLVRPLGGTGGGGLPGLCFGLDPVSLE